MLISSLTCDALLAGMEEVLLGSAEDVCLHRAYASTLLASRDPARMARGRFIETQLKLEDAALAADQRKKLEGRRRKFYQDHGRAWLGELAPLLLDRPGHKVELRRGWLDAVTAPMACGELFAALVRSPLARPLRRLVIDRDDPVRRPALAALLDAPFLPRLVELRIGDTTGDAESLIRRLSVEGT